MGRAGSTNRRLERIVAVLVALAVLAERVAGRSYPVRWLVLFLLRRADRVACDFVAGETQIEWPWPGDAGEGGNDPADAILLAARLRALAGLLVALLPEASRFPARIHAFESAPDRVATCLGGCFAALTGWAGRPNDTS